MAAADDHPRSGLSRRDALRLLAASSTTVAAGSLIVSQPAHADSGSAPCRYNFTQTPTVTVRITNQSGTRKDSLSITVSGVGGNCPCPGSAPQIEYAYWITIPGTGSGGAGWIASNAASVGSPTTLWGNSGGSVTVAVGVRVTCPAAVGNAIRCRFGSATYTVGGPNSNTAPNFPLGPNGGSPPTGIPPCESASPLLRSAPLLRSSSSNGLVVVPGAGTPPAYDPTAGEPSTDLGTPPADTTTTTDKPGNGPKDTVETTTTTTPAASTDTSTTSTTTAPTD